MVLHTKKISTVQLRRGMFIHKFCAPWWQHPFWRSNFLITSNTEIEKIIGSGVTDIIIDTSKGADVPDPNTTKPMEQSESSKTEDALIEVPARVAEVCGGHGC